MFCHVKTHPEHLLVVSRPTKPSWSRHKELQEMLELTGAEKAGGRKGCLKNDLRKTNNFPAIFAGEMAMFSGLTIFDGDMAILTIFCCWNGWFLLVKLGDFSGFLSFFDLRT